MGTLASCGADWGGVSRRAGGRRCCSCCCCCCCWAGVGRELFTGAHRREAGGRRGRSALAGDRPRRLRPNRLFLSDQRAGVDSGAGAGVVAVAVAVAAGGAVGGVSEEVIVTGGMVAASATRAPA
jgi:hypothetical protein